MPLLNPIWSALHSHHGHLALSTEAAARYLPDVSPFAALASPSRRSLEQLASLLAPGEAVWVFEEALPSAPSLAEADVLPCLQMLLPPDIHLPETAGDPTLLELTAADIPDMLSLIDLAYPGFFRAGTPRMGRFLGIRVAGQLVSMGGERFRMDGYSELTALCTHPDHRGHGYATRILWALAALHRQQGVRSFLHVGAANHPAHQLYEQLGFSTIAECTLRSLRRS